jgi:hypothetical protein
MKRGDPSPPNGNGALAGAGPENEDANDNQRIPKGAGARNDIYFMIGRRPIADYPDHALFVSTKPVTIEGVQYIIESWFTIRGKTPDFLVGRLRKRAEATA